MIGLPGMPRVTAAAPTRGPQGALRNNSRQPWPSELHQTSIKARPAWSQPPKIQMSEAVLAAEAAKSVLGAHGALAVNCRHSMTIGSAWARTVAAQTSLTRVPSARRPPSMRTSSFSRPGSEAAVCARDRAWKAARGVHGAWASCFHVALPAVSCAHHTSFMYSRASAADVGLEAPPLASTSANIGSCTPPNTSNACPSSTGTAPKKALRPHGASDVIRFHVEPKSSLRQTSAKRP
mmetsp:Transcript_21998/g.60872  ORF Transcript_21998/g.60872 Transcript_21998/m.60872 type:complete len:236 (-) Transcript_21998:1501-2208(-)